MSDEPDRPVSAPDVSHNPAETLLRWVERKELQVPAALLLELHRPLMPLAWSAAMLLGGVVAPLFGPDYYERIEALRDPRLLDRMLERLEASSRDQGGGG
jgi:hypothetical protein